MRDRILYVATLAVGIAACTPRDIAAGVDAGTALGLASIALLVTGLVLQRRQHARRAEDLRTLWASAIKRAALLEEQLDRSALLLKLARSRCRELESEAAQRNAEDARRADN